jgi:hypothetical protein
MIGKIILITVVSIFSLSSCSSMLGMGHEKTYCEEHGHDYSDAGVCGDPMQIYKNRKKLIKAINKR